MLMCSDPPTGVLTLRFCYATKASGRYKKVADGQQFNQPQARHPVCELQTIPRFKIKKMKVYLPDEVKSRGQFQIKSTQNGKLSR